MTLLQLYDSSKVLGLASRTGESPFVGASPGLCMFAGRIARWRPAASLHGVGGQVELDVGWAGHSRTYADVRLAELKGLTCWEKQKRKREKQKN